MGVDAVERRRARRGRHVRGARWRCGDLAIRIRRRLPPLRQASAGCWGFRTGTGASRRSAAGGGHSHSIGARRRSPLTRCRRGASGFRTSIRRCSEMCARRRREPSKFLAATQRPDGAWIPLWFGNEHAPGEDNPAYGTARVLLGLHSTLVSRRVRSRGLSPAARSRGSWRRRTPTEAGEAAAACLRRSRRPASCWRPSAVPSQTETSDRSRTAVARGARWLIDATDRRRRGRRAAGPVLRPALVLRGTLPARVRARRTGSCPGARAGPKRVNVPRLTASSRLPRPLSAS